MTLITRLRALACISLGLSLWTSAASAVGLTALWDFSRPEVSEQRFKTALETASGDDALILRTQIARTYGLRKDFDTARRLLREIEPAVPSAGPQAQVRYHLELGRSFASATHAAERLSQEDKARARQAYGRALELARAARLDGLAIDAIHMFAFIDTAPAEQLKWGQAALDLALSSSQPDARRWEASIRNNVGLALHQLGRREEALGQFQQALAIRERGTNAMATHVARWRVAWTLRSLSRTDEALAIQLALEQAADAARKPDPYVFEELEALYRMKGDTAKAGHYAQRKTAARER